MPLTVLRTGSRPGPSRVGAPWFRLTYAGDLRSVPDFDDPMNIRTTISRALTGALLLLGTSVVSQANESQDVPPVKEPTESTTAFERFDVNGDGVLSEQEKEAAMASIREARKRRPAARRGDAAKKDAEPAAGEGSSAAPGTKAPAGAGEKTSAPKPAQRPAPKKNAAGDPGVERLGAGDSKAARPDGRKPQAPTAAERSKAAAESAAQLRALALEQAKRELEEEQARLEAIQLERRAAVQRVVQDHRDQSSALRERVREYSSTREVILGEDMAYRFMSRFKSKPMKAPNRSFKPVNRQGVTRGKKRGSAYYNNKIKQGLRGRGGRGGRRGNGNGNGNGNF